jgi:hypothetical protein
VLVPLLNVAGNTTVTVVAAFSTPVIVNAAAAALVDKTVTALPRATVPRARSFVLKIVSAAFTVTETAADVDCPNDKDETMSRRTAARIRFFILYLLKICD